MTKCFRSAALLLLLLGAGLATAQQPSKASPPAAPVVTAPIAGTPVPPPPVGSAPIPGTPASPVPSATSPATPAVTETTNYLMPVETQKQIRDLQLEWDELEIEIQRNLVKNEQDKQAQAAAMLKSQKLAFQFATEKKIDLQIYELDSKDLKFVVKKKAAAK